MNRETVEHAPPNVAAWHALPVVQAYERLQTTETGLTSDEAARRLERYGPNVLPSAGGGEALKILIRQLQPFGRDLSLELMHVHAGDTKASARDSELLLRLACEFLTAHGFERINETSMAGGAPAARLLEQADRGGAA